MENKLMNLETPELQGIEKSKAKQIIDTFKPMSEMLTNFENAYNKVIAESEKDITQDVISRAKRLRIDIGKVRIQTEKVRKEQKEEYLRAGKAIDGVSNILKWAVSDKENKLKEIEDYFEIQEQKRLEKLQTERSERLSAYVEDAHERDLKKFEDDEFEALFQMKKKEHEERIEAERKAEEERKELARKEELLKVRKDEMVQYADFFDWDILTTELSDEAYEALKKDVIEAKKEFQKAQAEKERLRKQAETKLKAEQEAKAKLEAELKAKREAEEKAQREIEAQEEAKKKACDADKIKHLIASINSIELPEVKSADAKKKVAGAGELLGKIIQYLKS